ncbi:MAG: polyphosphate kinase 2 family protein [Rhodospirillales bacterium]|nr:polyphosphate kinase 2 family protein [Rhodospirillales bacterium]
MGSDRIAIASRATRRILDRCRVVRDHKFRLKDHDPADTGGLGLDRRDADILLEEGVARLAALQEQFFAAKHGAVLCCLQAMDTAGKDGTIKHVMSGVNPQGVRVTSFKVPSAEERAHDFLWRMNRALPMRGEIGIFNRSHYEDVLVTRVHPERLDRTKPPGVKFWTRRLQAIAAWEEHLAREGTAVIKFFLHISRAEQKRRLLARLNNADKHWKFSDADLAERQYWDDYQHAYEQAITATASKHAPWFVVPADHKWFARLVVVGALIEVLEGADRSLPAPDLTAIAAARAALEAEAD